MPLVSGATAAGFSILRPLEYGEFGELYEAEHPRLPRHQTLQLIPAEVSADLDYRELFTQESDLAATLWHPNIIGITDRGEFEEQLWISTDYIDGNDTATLLGTRYPDGMPPKMVIEIVSAVADALDYAHDCGVLHRYVNPGVILVSKSPSDQRRVALTGFGVARPFGEVNNTLTRANLFIGTASFTAPEQLMDEAVDGRADQYALAGSAFHLLTGSPPFAHFNPSVTINKHLSERPPRASEIRPDLTDFDAIFARALSQDPIDRFRRCRDFAKALELNGGIRAHVRPASIVRDATDDPPATAASLVAKPAPDGAALTEPATPAAPDIKNGDAAAPPDVLADAEIDDAAPSAEPAASGTSDDYDDDDHDYDDEAKSRRLLHTAAIAGVLAVVVLAGFFGVRTLRPASESNHPPTSVDSGSAQPTTPPQPAMATSPPALIPPPPVRRAAPLQPVVSAPATATTTSPKITTSPPVTTSATAAPRTTVPQTTNPSSAPSTSRKKGLDTRPAIGMPCGPDKAGASAVSNSGGPVRCVDTPGGSAWEPGS
jgi:serine/threonine protein kinase, bacterial